MCGVAGSSHGGLHGDRRYASFRQQERKARRRRARAHGTRRTLHAAGEVRACAREFAEGARVRPELRRRPHRHGRALRAARQHEGSRRSLRARGGFGAEVGCGEQQLRPVPVRVGPLHRGAEVFLAGHGRPVLQDARRALHERRHVLDRSRRQPSRPGRDRFPQGARGESEERGGALLHGENALREERLLPRTRFHPALRSGRPSFAGCLAACAQHREQARQHRRRPRIRAAPARAVPGLRTNPFPRQPDTGLALNMGRTDHAPDDAGKPADGTDAPASGNAERAQMSFFDSDVPPTMNSDNHNSDDEQVQCGDTSKLDALAIDAAPGATPDALPKEEASPAESALPEGNAETEISADEPQADALAEHMGQADEPLRYVEKTAVDVSESLGQRLRAAREARGWRGEDVAQRLKLPLSTIQALEGDCYDRIGHGIYLRSYVTKYLRLLDLPQVLAERALGQEVELPPLVTSGTISRPRYLFQRYSVSALYLILTGVIIVPAVLLAMRAGFEPNLA